MQEQSTACAEPVWPKNWLSVLLAIFFSLHGLGLSGTTLAWLGSLPISHEPDPCALGFVMLWPVNSVLILGLLVVFLSLLTGLFLYQLIATIRTPDSKKKNRKGRGWEWLVFIAFPMANFALSFPLEDTVRAEQVTRTFTIPAASMAPTLEPGNYIVSTKIAPKDIKRGDVIIFEKDPGVYFIKRIMALPGDTIDIDNHVVTVNGITEQWTAKPEKAAVEYYGHEFFEYEVCFDSYCYDTLRPDNSSSVSKVALPATLGEGQYFALGDNRANSNDSRFLGAIRADQIGYRMTFVLWGRFKHFPARD